MDQFPLLIGSVIGKRRVLYACSIYALCRDLIGVSRSIQYRKRRHMIIIRSRKTKLPCIQCMGQWSSPRGTSSASFPASSNAPAGEWVRPRMLRNASSTSTVGTCCILYLHVRTHHKTKFTKFKIQNSKFEIQNSKFKIQNLKFKIWNLKSKIRIPKSKI